jgi:transposase
MFKELFQEIDIEIANILETNVEQYVKHIEYLIKEDPDKATKIIMGVFSGEKERIVEARKLFYE